MHRFDAEDPGQSLYTPTTVGVIRIVNSTVESAIWGLIARVTGTGKV